MWKKIVGKKKICENVIIIYWFQFLLYYLRHIVPWVTYSSLLYVSYWINQRNFCEWYRLFESQNYLLLCVILHVIFFNSFDLPDLSVLNDII